MKDKVTMDLRPVGRSELNCVPWVVHITWLKGCDVHSILMY